MDKETVNDGCCTLTNSDSSSGQLENESRTEQEAKIKLDWPAVSRFALPLFVFLIFLSASLLKVSLYEKTPGFNLKDDRGFYNTESAFHYRYARMVAEGKRIPTIDTRIQYPEGIRVFSNITVFMEIVVGKLYRFVLTFFPRIPFHVFLAYFICFFSSISIFAVYLVTVQLCRRWYAGILAALFYGFTIATFNRTIGAYLREDFALPFIFFSLYFFIRSLRAKSAEQFAKQYLFPILSGIFIVIALASWHFSRFYFLLFTLLVGVLILFGEKEPQERLFRSFGIIVVLCILGGLIVPVLRAKLFIISLPMLISYWLLAVSFFGKNWNKMKRAAVFSVLFIISAAVVIFLLKGQKEYSHVYALLLNKIKFLGLKPTDPTLLPYEVRSMWVEALDRASLFLILFSYATLFPLAIVSIGWSAWNFLRRKIGTEEEFLLLCAIAFLILFLAVRRISPFFVFFAAIFCGKLVVRKTRITEIIIAVLLTCCLIFQYYQSKHFYDPTAYKSFVTRNFPSRRRPFTFWMHYLLGVYRWIGNETTTNESFLTGIGISPRIAAYTDRPIILHSKFESKRIRDKTEEFRYAFYGTEEKLYQFCRKYKVNYLLYSSGFLFDNSIDSERYIVGLQKLSKDNLAHKFHFHPEKLNYFLPVYQNTFFRIFKFYPEGIPSNAIKELPYQPTFDENFFIQDDEKSQFFNDGKTKEMLWRIAQGEKHFRNGWLYAHKGWVDKAIGEYKKALEYQPNLIGLHTALGMEYLKKGNYDQGIKHCERELITDLYNPDTHFNLAGAYFVAKRFPEAVKELEETLKLDPEHKKAKQMMEEIKKRRFYF